MTDVGTNKRRLKFPFYVTKKLGVASWKIWVIRAVGIVLAFILAGVVCNILKPGSFGLFYKRLYESCFDFSDFSSFIDLSTIRFLSSL